MMERIRVSDNGWNFETVGSGEAFIPFGTNYLDPDTGLLDFRQLNIEAVSRHFDQMAELGANAVRIFLTSRLIPQQDAVDEHAFESLDKVVDIARERGIRLFLTGPHPTGPVSPEWACDDFFADDRSLAAQECFWTHFAARYKSEPAIWACDLINEPSIKWDSKSLRRKWNQWVASKYGNVSELGSAWRDFTPDEQMNCIRIPNECDKPGDRRLRDYQLFRESIAVEWTKRMVQAIKSVDSERLVSIGYIQNSFLVACDHTPKWYSGASIEKTAPYLDFLAPHWYPLHEGFSDPLASEAQIQEGIKYLLSYLEYCDMGKPVVLSEFGWYGGGSVEHGWRGPMLYVSEEAQASYNEVIIRATAGHCAGWLVWLAYDAPLPTDISEHMGLFTRSGHVKEWGKTFAQLVDELTAAQTEKAVFGNREPMDWESISTSSAAAIDLYRTIVDKTTNTGVL